MKTVSILILVIFLAGCNPFPYENSHISGGVWSDDGSSILYYKLSYTQWDFLAIDAPSREDPELTLKIINPDGSGKETLPVQQNAWAESMYYMKTAGYIVYNYFGGDVGDMVIALYRFNGEHTVLVDDAEPFDSEHIRVIPSRDGSILVKVTPQLEGYGLYDMPVITAVMTFTDASTLNEISEIELTFYEYFDYLWYTDGTFIIRDFASWNETDDTYTGYRINPSDGSSMLITIPDDYINLQETSSTGVSEDGMIVYVDDDGIHIEEEYK